MALGDSIRRMFIIDLLMVSLLMGCATAKHDYLQAKRKNTIEAYEAFLQKYPDAKQAALAKAQLVQLETERDWQLAESTHDAARYQEYISKHPESRNSGLAEKRIKELQSEAAWRKAEQQDAIGAYQNYLSTYPKSPNAKAATERIEALTAKQDWVSVKARNSIEAYQGYLKKHPTSEHILEAGRRLKLLLAERDWRAAMDQNTETGWVDYIVKYPHTPETEDAIKRLRRHKLVKPGGVISWERLGGKSWSQPLEDGFSNYEGSRFKRAIVSRQRQLTYSCGTATELEFPHWVLLNKIKVTGHLKACPDGFRLVKGLALIPTKK
jgi:outer membrane protein assembly factor BamD (BamD/ComL family)